MTVKINIDDDNATDILLSVNGRVLVRDVLLRREGAR